MRRVWTAGALAIALSLHAQETPDPVADAKSATEPPISFSFGPQEDGGFGVVVKGAAYYPMRRFINPVPDGQVAPLKQAHFGGFFTPSAYLYLSPEVNFGTQAGAQNQYSISARPSFQVSFQKDTRNLPLTEGGLPVLPASLPWQIWPQAAPFFEAYADVRRHSAQNDATAEEASSAQNTDATFYGAGIGIAVPYISRAIEASSQGTPDFEPGVFPMLRITYYKSDGSSASDSPLGADIKADQIDAALVFALPLRAMGNIKPRLDFNGDLSKPLKGDDRKWKSLVKASLMLDIAGSSFKPVVSYTSGERFGLQFDRQMLLGVALDLAGGLFNKTH
jgi:hypothetical protein